MPASIKKNRLDDIIPFPEMPSRNKYKNKDKDENELAASDLFSHFTADIIKQDVIFIR
jgi:hypothetical protein